MPKSRLSGGRRAAPRPRKVSRRPRKRPGTSFHTGTASSAAARYNPAAGMSSTMKKYKKAAKKRR